MTEEIKQEIKEERCKCLTFFLLNILASFLGCLVALCIYNAATKPQFPPIMIKGPCPIMQQNFHREHHPNFRGGHHDFKFHKQHNGVPVPSGQKPPAENK